MNNIKKFYTAIILLMCCMNGLMAGMNIGDKIYLSNDEVSALHCVMGLFPHKENIQHYKLSIQSKQNVVGLIFFEHHLNNEVDILGGGGVQYSYEYKKLSHKCTLVKKNNMR